MPVGRMLRAPLFRLFPTRTSILPLAGRQAPRSPLTLSARSRGPLTRHSHSTSPSPPPSPSTAPALPTSLSGRLRALIKTHGWYALGVYFSLSVLDFSLTFAAIYLLGAEQVDRVTGRVKDTVYEAVGYHPKSPTYDVDEGTVAAHGVKAGDGYWAMAILAYGIHKTLWLPVRVGVTAAVTPGFVAFLTRRGWVGQGGARRAAQHVRSKVRKSRDVAVSP